MAKSKTTKFSSILSQLRKERGISQKKASADLGISQALLSHYEKGIRECGLDFIIRCSEYYGVTTDYLLGVSESRNGLGNDYLSKYSDDNLGGKSVATLNTFLILRLPLQMTLKKAIFMITICLLSTAEH